MPITAPATSAGLIPAADLAAFTAPNGVLTRQLDGLIGHPSVAIGIDPMILASIRVLGTAAPASATQWMVSLSELPNDVFSLGYGDADLAGQFQSGLTAPLAPTSLGYAMDPANFQTTPTSVGEPTASADAGDCGRHSDPDADHRGRPRPPDSRPADRLAVLPSRHRVAGRGLRAHGRPDVAGRQRFHDDDPFGRQHERRRSCHDSERRPPDHAAARHSPPMPGISTALRDAATASDDTSWNAAMSQVNAQLGLVSEDGGGQRNLVLTLGRSWPSSGTQLERTFRAILTSPWTNSVTFPRSCRARRPPGSTLKSKSETEARLTGIKGLLDTETRIDDFATILDDPTTMTGPEPRPAAHPARACHGPSRATTGRARYRTISVVVQDPRLGEDPADGEREPGERAGIDPVHGQQRPARRGGDHRAQRFAVEQQARDRRRRDQAHPAGFARDGAGSGEGEAGQRPGHPDACSC